MTNANTYYEIKLVNNIALETIKKFAQNLKKNFTYF